MKKGIFIILLLLVGPTRPLKAQDNPFADWIQSLLAPDNSDIVIIDLEYNISPPAAKLVKEIEVGKELFFQTRTTSLQACIDSTRRYGGNCFKVTYYDDGPYTIIIGGDRQKKIRGAIYTLDENEIKDIRSRIESYEPPEGPTAYLDTLDIVHEGNAVFQYGGESQLAIIFPKFNILRKHQFDFVHLYYGLEAGLHVMLLGPYGSVSGIIGIEKGIFNLESSISHFWVAGRKGEYPMEGFSRRLFNLKFGVGISGVRLKVGKSYLLGPEERKDAPALGKINNTIWGVELQLRLGRG